MPELILVPSILALTIVAPLWIIMHYRSKRHATRGLSERERESMDEILETIDVLVDRVETLEKILDSENANWRSKANDEASTPYSHREHSH